VQSDGTAMMNTQKRNLALLLGCESVSILGMTMLVPVMPLYMRQLTPPSGSGFQQWSALAFAAPGLGALLFAPLAGRLCDRFGERRLLLAALLLCVTSLLCMGASHSILGFLTGRLLLGASEIGVVLTAFISRLGGPLRGFALGLQESAVAIGALLGSLLGGLLLDFGSVRPLLIMTALITGGMGLLLWTQLQETEITAPSSPLPFNFRTVLGNAWLRRYMLALCLVRAAAYALFNLFALFMLARFPHAKILASKIGGLHALEWLGLLIGGPIWGKLNDLGDPQRNFMLAAVGCALCISLMPLTQALWQIAWLKLLQGICYAALIQAILTACLKRLPDAVNGSLVGISKSFTILGQMLGPTLLIPVLDRLSPGPTLWLVALMFLLAAVLVWVPADSALARGSACPGNI
jgi:MFS transporter, DHA1 family, staphyloferrin B biosynthesis exporter